MWNKIKSISSSRFSVPFFVFVIMFGVYGVIAIWLLKISDERKTLIKEKKAEQLVFEAKEKKYQTNIKYLNQEYRKVADKNYALLEILKKNETAMQQDYLKKKLENKKVYEKVIQNITVVGTDENIRILTDNLSK